MLSIKEEGRFSIVLLDTESINLQKLPALRKEFAETQANLGLGFVVSLEKVEHIDSMGLGWLATLQKGAKAEGQQMCLLINQKLQKQFNLTRFDAYCRVFFDQAEAIAFLNDSV